MPDTLSFISSDIQKELDNLTEDEKKVAIEILKQYSESGSSDVYQDLVYQDYEEIPVDIETFLYDEYYLGKSLIDSEGRKTVYPYWVETLKKIFPTNVDTAYNTLALTGSIGIGKSFMAVLCILYQLYRMMCLKDPYLHYGLQPIDKITFAFINITMDAAAGVGWQKCQELLQNSPWFMKNGSLSGSTNIVWVPPKGIDLLYGSLPRHIIGRAVFSVFCDEVSFVPTQDVEMQKKKAKDLVNTASARMQSRFMHGEHNPTLLILASSKRTEQSYMETFIEGKKNNDSKTTYIVDEPQWVIRTDKDSAVKFKVAVGNKFLNSEVVPLNSTEADLQTYRDRGYTLMDVPMGYYENFIDDINIALTDIAGISTSGTTKYFSGTRIAAVRNEKRKNLFTKEIISVGDGADDKTQYSDFIDKTRIDPKLKSRPLYIHLDMSVSGDATGIGGVWINGKKPTKPGEDPSKDLYYTLAFHVSIKAPKGCQVSFEKNRNFIRWLRQEGFNIKGVSADTFQSYDLLQVLKGEHFNTSIISVDRVDREQKVCLPYLTFKNAIYEERFDMYPTTELVEELLDLEKDGNGKIDHTPMGRKDAADGVCGALYNASQHAEEFSFDWGETIQTTIDVSQATTEVDREQIVLNFEEELKKLDSIQPNKSTFLDFGMGKASELYSSYLANGIIL